LRHPTLGRTAFDRLAAPALTENKVPASRVKADVNALTGMECTHRVRTVGNADSAHLGDLVRPDGLLLSVFLYFLLQPLDGGISLQEILKLCFQI